MRGESRKPVDGSISGVSVCPIVPLNRHRHRARGHATLAGPAPGGGLIAIYDDCPSRVRALLLPPPRQVRQKTPFFPDRARFSREHYPNLSKNERATCGQDLALVGDGVGGRVGLLAATLDRLPARADALARGEMAGVGLARQHHALELCVGEEPVAHHALGHHRAVGRHGMRDGRHGAGLHT